MQLSGFKFIVVDKSVFACQMVQDTLFELGARQITYATEVKNAMAQIRSGKADFLICEHDLKGESGLDLITEIRSDDDQSIKTMPIILLTSLTDRASIFAGRDGGVDEIIAKPFTAAAIKARLDAIIKKRRKFIDERAYSGPDRRRHHNIEFDGEDRRDG